MSNKQKKLLKKTQIKMGLRTKRERSAIWQYLLNNNLGIGYANAKDLEALGFQILKRSYYEDQPN